MLRPEGTRVCVVNSGSGTLPRTLPPVISMPAVISAVLGAMT